MSKTDYSKVSPELVQRVSGVINEAAHHRYSVSRVYAAYNEAFGKNEKSQTCSSCLRNRVRELARWKEGYYTFLADQEKPEPPVVGAPAESEEGTDGNTGGDEGKKDKVDTDPNNPQYAAPAPGAIRVPMAEGAPVDFIPAEDGEGKGTVKYADGTAVKPGSYKTTLGKVITVQVGGKARMYEDAPAESEEGTDGNTGGDANESDAAEAGAAVSQDDQESLL